MRINDLMDFEPKLKRSPLKAAPLHSAGQSLDDEIGWIQATEISSYAAAIAFFAFIAIIEWVRWFFSMPPSPVLITLVALGFGSYCVMKIVRTKKLVKALELGRDVERAVGEYLDRFREKGYRVFHDIVAGDFNIDHLLLGEAGVFTVETKGVSKKAKGNQKIVYDGNNVIIDGFKPDRDPIIQAKAQASWVREILRDLTGKDLPVQPVVLFPGWFIDGKAGSEVWVLNPKALPSFIEHKEPVLNRETIRAVATHSQGT
jgi:hypothetical protein